MLNIALYDGPITVRFGGSLTSKPKMAVRPLLAAIITIDEIQDLVASRY